MSILRKEDIIAAKKKDGKILVKLKDEIWYSLVQDIFEADAQGGPFMAYINSISEEE